MKDDRQKIRDAAITLFARHGVDVSMSSVATTALVPAKTVHGYYSSKQDLIDDVFIYLENDTAHSIADGLTDNMGTEEAFRHIWYRVITRAMTFPDRHNASVAIWNSNAASDTAQEEFDVLHTQSIGKIERAISNQDVTEISTPYLIDLAVSQMIVAIRYAMDEQMAGQELDHHIDTTFQYFWRGVNC